MFWELVLFLGVVSTLMYILCDTFRVDEQNKENSR